MKTICLAGVLALCGFTVIQDQDTKAKTILDEVSKKTKGYTAIQAEFSLTSVMGKNPKGGETTTGKATIKGNKYIVAVNGGTIKCDGKNIETTNEGDDEPIVEPVDEADDEMNPVKLLTIWEKGFKFRYIGEKKENGITVHEIQLSPSDPGNKKYHTVTVKIDKNKSQVYSVAIKKKNNDVNTLTITKFIPNATVSDDLFKIKK
ncbi:MAG: outer membrane lipoprotein carrier protein LolA [Flavobacteriales bacterium]